MNTPRFEVKELSLPGVLLLKPKIHSDLRGMSANVYRAADLEACGVTVSFTEDFMSCSKKGVLRGLHFQRSPHAQDKLVRCSNGEIFDVAADCDPTSVTYGQHVSVNLKSENQDVIYIPGKYAHGYCVLSDRATVEYKLSDIYDPEVVGGARFDDPVLNISWPIREPILSERDKRWIPLKA